MSQGELLGDGAATGEPAHVGVLDAGGGQHRGGGVGHARHRERLGRQRRAAGARVVEGGEPVAVGQPVELGLPRLGNVAEPGDEEHVGAFAPLVDPQAVGRWS